MIGIIIGDLMASTKGELNDKSTYTDVTTTAVAIAEWILSGKEKYEAKADLPLTAIIPIAIYSQDLQEAMSKYIDAETDLGVDKKQAGALADLMQYAKRKANKEKLAEAFEAGYGETPMTAVMKLLAKNSSFWPTVSRAILLKGNPHINGGLAGGIAGAYFGLSDSIRTKAMKLIPTEMQKIVLEFDKQSRERNTDEAIAQLRFLQR